MAINGIIVIAIIVVMAVLLAVGMHEKNMERYIPWMIGLLFAVLAFATGTITITSIEFS